jgi:DNA polymerase-3 subunit alpha
LNRKSLESLIKCGALDSLNSEEAGGRGTLLQNIETMLEFHREATAVAPQDSLFGTFAAPLPLTLVQGQPVSLFDKLTWEKELLGIYVSGHPLDAHADIVQKAKLTIQKVKEEMQQGMLLILPVLVTTVRSILTKSGEKMAFITVEDTTDSIEAVVFPKLLKEHTAIVTAGNCLLLKGRVSIRNGEPSLAIEELKPL